MHRARRIISRGFAKRRRGERKDSVPASLLDLRAAHREAMRGASTDPEVAAAVRRLRLGRHRGFANPKTAARRVGPDVRSELVASWWSMRRDDMPRARPGEVEFALVGHSNCGKSALLNALAGVDGLARVSARAGWTDAISWYRIVDEMTAMEEEWEAEENEEGVVVVPPETDDDGECGSGEDEELATGELPPRGGVQLIDLPGYGAAVGADRKQQDRWSSAAARLLDANRASLRRVFILVDAGAGLCDEDREMLAALEKLKRPYTVALTKVDTLSTAALAQCHAVVADEVFRGDWARAATTFKGAQLAMVSAKHSQGIAQLWREMRVLAEKSPKSLSLAGGGEQHAPRPALVSEVEEKPARMDREALQEDCRTTTTRSPVYIAEDGSEGVIEGWNDMPPDEQILVREFVGHQNEERRALLRERGGGVSGEH